MSENQRDDEQELRAFLSGESALSRHYRELVDDEPPPHVDSAILASARWAVGADAGQTSQRSGAASGWWHGFFSKWSAPLATAVVVVLAVALTLTLEREPQLERVAEPLEYRQKEQERTDIALSEAQQLAEEAVSNAMQPKARVPIAQEKQESPAEPGAPVSSAPVPNAPVPSASLQARQQASIVARERDASGSPGQEAPVAEPKKKAPPAPVAAARVEESRSAEDRGPVAVLGDAIAPASPSEGAAAEINKELEAELPPTETVPALPMAADVTETELAESVAGEGLDAGDGAAVAGRSAELAKDQTTTAQVRSAVGAQGQLSPQQWIADIEVQLNRGNRELAIAALKKFRERYPDYTLPPRLKALLPENER